MPAVIEPLQHLQLTVNDYSRLLAQAENAGLPEAICEAQDRPVQALLMQTALSHESYTPPMPLSRVGSGATAPSAPAVG